MTTEQAYTNASRALISATMVYEAKRAEFNGICWVDDKARADAARVAAHQALDAMLDAQQVQIEILKRQQEGGALVAQQ